MSELLFKISSICIRFVILFVFVFFKFSVLSILTHLSILGFVLSLSAAALRSAPWSRPTANAAPTMTRIIARRGGRLAAASTCTSARRALSHSLVRRRHRQSQHASIRTATPARRAASAYRRSVQPIQLARPFGAPTGSCSRATRAGRVSYVRPMASAARSR